MGNVNFGRIGLANVGHRGGDFEWGEWRPHGSSGRQERRSDRLAEPLVTPDAAAHRVMEEGTAGTSHGAVPTLPHRPMTQ
ncbi:hypothetical protein E4U21_005099 [Claviceps maximensis]|nr:hypothetical protein E4U21_005099 [Claviceps maximensis]